MRYLFLITLMTLATACVQQTQTTFEKGVRAYEQGNYERSYATMKALAETGHPGAQFYLGLLYRKGQGTAQSYRETLAQVPQKTS